MSDALLAPEARALLLVARGAEADPVFQATLREPALSWSRMLQIAEKEKATPMLWAATRSLPAAVVPKEWPDRLAIVARVSEFRMLQLERRLLVAWDVLAQAGVPTMLLKGAALAVTVYGSFSERPMGDIDLLVREADAERGWGLLRDSGWLPERPEEMASFYQTHHHLMPLKDPDGSGVALEVHTAINSGGVGLSSDALWRTARTVEWKGRRLVVPATEEQMVHLAVHFAWSNVMSGAAWRTFRDLRLLIDRVPVDWSRLVRLAEESRARTACYWTFRLARALGGARIPDATLLALRPPRPEAMLRVLERHYTANLFPFGGTACPSVRLGTMLWSAGMLPRWSGHGAVRPWERSEAWTEASGTAGPRARRLPDVTVWARYLGTLVRAG